jgi:hypothetical protein
MEMTIIYVYIYVCVHAYMYLEIDIDININMYICLPRGFHHLHIVLRLLLGILYVHNLIFSSSNYFKQNS